MRIAAVVPTLDEASVLAATLGRLRDQVDELLVVDGGSEDQTVAVARQAGARVLTAPRGRGSQLRAGAAATDADVIWFVHADAQVPPDGARRLSQALADPRVAGGNFALRFDSQRPLARFLAWLYPRLGLLGLHYGDSAIFVRRQAYEAIGGLRPMPLFEDVDLVSRLRRVGRFERVPAVVLASSRRFEGRRALPVVIRWIILQLLYWAGVPAASLARHYPAVRTLAVALGLACLVGQPAVAAPRILFLGDLQCERTPARLDALRPLCADVDLVVVNLEGPLTARPFARLDKQWHLRSTPALAAALAALAPHRVVGLVANNHAGDCGDAGVDDTRRVMSAAGLYTAGEARWPPPDPVPLMVNVRGQAVAVLAANLVPPARGAVAWRSTEWSERLVAQVRRLSAAHPTVIVCLHWNAAEAALPPPDERTLARRLVEAGAAVVAGFHPHMLGAVERLDRGLILYSVGNTALSCPCSQQPQGAAMRVEVDGEARAIPLLCGRIANGLRVTLAGAGDARAILDWLNTISIDFKTVLDAKGRIRQTTRDTSAKGYHHGEHREHGGREGLQARADARPSLCSLCAGMMPTGGGPGGSSVKAGYQPDGALREDFTAFNSPLCLGETSAATITRVALRGRRNECRVTGA